MFMLHKTCNAKSLSYFQLANICHNDGGYVVSTLKKKVLHLVKTNFTQIIFQQLSSIQIRVAFQMRGISLPRFSRRSRVRDSVNTSITFCLINKISVLFRFSIHRVYRSIQGCPWFSVLCAQFKIPRLKLKNI